MLRVPAAMAILALLAPLAVAQRKGSPAKPAQTPRRPPLQRLRETPLERPEGHRRSDRLPQHRLAADPRPDRIAQRGGAGQVGLRPLLRAHDVPGHTGLSAREVPGDPDPGRRPPERLHDRRLHQLPHDLLQGRPRPDAPGGGRPVPAPLLRRGRVQDRVARGARRVQQEQRQPDQQARRSPAGEGLHHAHVQAHDDGLPQGHRGHAQPVRLLEGVLPTLVPPRAHDDHRRGRRPGRTRLRPRREVLGRLEARDLPRRDPPGTSGQGARVHARQLAEPDAALGQRRIPLPGLLRHREVLRGARHALRPHLRRDLRPLQEARRDRAEGRPDLRRQRRRAGSVARDGVRARQEARGRGLRARPDSRRLRRRDRDPGRRPAPRRREEQRPLQLRAAPRQHGDDRREPGAVRSLRPLLPDAQPALPGLRLARRRKTSRPSRRPTSPTPTSSSRRFRARRCPKPWRRSRRSRRSLPKAAGRRDGL